MCSVVGGEGIFRDWKHFWHLCSSQSFNSQWNYIQWKCIFHCAHLRVKSKYITKFFGETVLEMSSLSNCSVLWDPYKTSYIKYVLNTYRNSNDGKGTVTKLFSYKLQGLKTSSCEWVIFKWSLRTFVVIVRRVQTDPPNSPLCPGAS